MSRKRGDWRSAPREWWPAPGEDRTGWQSPDTEISARASPFGRAVEVTMWWPARADVRRGDGTSITPEAARQLSAELLDAATKAEAGKPWWSQA